MSKQRTARALEDIRRRTFSRCHWMRYDHLSLKRLQETRDELLDHFAAHTLKDPTLAGDSARAGPADRGPCRTMLWTRGNAGRLRRVRHRPSIPHMPAEPT
ncbi:hypothetical protein OG427_39590 [Streptomyces sp. NBC_00133]|uniref:hypothetical protein n=1 Tax=Streptomyces sp. NBC_00133 TaxID=2903624 RepID=UPI003253EB87